MARREVVVARDVRVGEVVDEEARRVGLRRVQITPYRFAKRRVAVAELRGLFDARDAITNCTELLGRNRGHRRGRHSDEGTVAEWLVLVAPERARLPSSRC